MSNDGQEIIKGTSAEVPQGKPFGENPKDVRDLRFFHTILTLPPGQWKVDVPRDGMTRFHYAVASGHRME